MELFSLMLREPLKFAPILQEKIWGGDGLYRILKKGCRDDKGIGESWELSDNDTAQNLIYGGSFDGQSFRGVFLQHKAEILGRHAGSDVTRFPLLYKFIYASDKLSVQVHPGEGSPLGDAKTETWYIVDAPRDARIIVGLAPNQKGRSREEILATLKSSDCRDALNHIPVAKGDVLFIPAGAVHAITEGLLLYEVQQNSDCTFRLYDWDRKDAKGNSRDLHLEEASQVMDLEIHDRHKIPPLTLPGRDAEVTYLVASPYFLLQKIAGISGRWHLRGSDRFHVLTCLSGQGTLNWNDGRMETALGETVLLPASMDEIRLDAPGEAEFLLSFIPDLEQDLRRPLLAAGHDEKEIAALQGLDASPG